MKPVFELAGGGALQIAEIEGERVVVEAARAFPPGSTLDFMPSSTPAAAFVFKIKVRSCRRSAQAATFRIEGRFVSLSREAREFLTAAD
ncbi:MAG TPA: hypothetical protein VK524_15270 [Polyangiaceae bacterium]|nr:hypothetical protein [Polyangiaceae bacterium]